MFTLWLNSLDVEPGVYNLFEDLKVADDSDPHRADVLSRTAPSFSRASTK